MPNWSEVLKEIQHVSTVGPLDLVRRKYIAQLSTYTKRNVIIYYSGWLQRTSTPLQSMIFDGDINSFMCCINGLDRTLGLDLVLHTPGGITVATESIVNYLKKMFDSNIRCFIPQLAMSGGTMIACACKEIYMGKQSSIGPIDPQFGNMAAFGVIDELSYAKQDIQKHPETIPIWQAIYSKIPPGFIIECQQAIDHSESLVMEWLTKGMFKNRRNKKALAQGVVSFLNNHKHTKSHGRHINCEQAKKLGLKIRQLESDQTLQDLVLTLHHACMHTFSQVQNLHKMVENQHGVGMFLKG